MGILRKGIAKRTGVGGGWLAFRLKPKALASQSHIPIVRKKISRMLARAVGAIAGAKAWPAKRKGLKQAYAEWVEFRLFKTRDMLHRAKVGTVEQFAGMSERMRKKIERTVLRKYKQSDKSLEAYERRISEMKEAQLAAARRGKLVK